jgi:hypothetical protein
MFDKNSLIVDEEIYSKLCIVATKVQHDHQNVKAFNLRSMLHDKSFENTRQLCSLKHETRKEIKEKLIKDFGEHSCVVTTPKSKDFYFERCLRERGSSGLCKLAKGLGRRKRSTVLDSEKYSKDEENRSENKNNGIAVTQIDLNKTSSNNESLKDNSVKENQTSTTTKPNLSIASNLCTLSPASQSDFLHIFFGFSSPIIEFINETCFEFSNLTQVFGVIQEVEKFVYKPEIACITKEKQFDNICSKSESEIEDFFKLSRKLRENRKLQPERMCEIDEDSRRYFLKHVGTYSTEEMTEFDLTCNESREAFLKDSSGFYFNLNDVDLNLICKVDRENRKNFLTSLYDLKQRNVELLMEFCDTETLNFEQV